MVRGRFSLCVEKITTLIGAISVPYIKPLANADAGSPPTSSAATMRLDRKGLLMRLA